MRTLKTVSPRQSAEFPDADTSRSDWQSGFLKLLPAIQTRLRFAFRRLSSEAREEAVQESTCAACRAYARLSVLGRAHVATAASLASYAAAQYRAGRRVGAPLNVNDVCSEHCRLRKGVTVERLGRRAGDAWREALVEDRTVTPADLAASRIDYPKFLAGLSPKARGVAEALAGGEHPGEVAARFGVSAARVSQFRRELRAAWLRFHGEADSAVVGVDPAERKSLSRLDTKSPTTWISEFPSHRSWTTAVRVENGGLPRLPSSLAAGLYPHMSLPRPEFVPAGPDHSPPVHSVPCRGRAGIASPRLFRRPRHRRPTLPAPNPGFSIAVSFF